MLRQTKIPTIEQSPLTKNSLLCLVRTRTVGRLGSVEVLNILEF